MESSGLPDSCLQEAVKSAVSPRRSRTCEFSVKSNAAHCF